MSILTRGKMIEVINPHDWYNVLFALVHLLILATGRQHQTVVTLSQNNEKYSQQEIQGYHRLYTWQTRRGRHHTEAND